ncbi:MAG: transposase [Sedimentisphaerales bacterium]|nr:transposase [Sedimentisphaerales bacterium]
MRTWKGRKVFFTDQDRVKYLECLAESSKQYKLDVLAWCLMPDHINLVVLPQNKDSLAKAVGRANFSYANYLNRKRKKDGKVWRGRFQSCALDDTYLKLAVCYVENMPVYEKIVRKPEKFPWSSAQAHITGKDKYELLSLDVWPAKRLRNKWSKFLAQKLDEQVREKIRMFTQTGMPLGSDEFIKKLERRFRRRLHPLPIGRPKGT